VPVIGLSGSTGLSAGLGNGLAVKSDGTAWGWGGNSNGRLGDGTTDNVSTPVQVMTGVRLPQ